jgi:hypothetical protein
MEAPTWRLSTAFAILAAATILTKGNGCALALVPPISIALGRRWELLKRPSLYGSAIIVAAATAPWYFLTTRLVVPTFQYEFTPGFVASATWFLWSLLFGAPGILVSSCAVIGMAVKVIRPYSLGRVESLWGAAFAQIISVWVFHALIPAGMETRYILASLAPWLMFSAAGVQWVSERLKPVAWPARASAIVLSAVVGIVFFATVFRIPQRRRLGFQEVAEQLTSNPEFRNSVILCSSEGSGEGLLISEVAMREARPGHIILRASRMLADSDWNGRFYKAKMDGPPAVQRFLEAAAVDVVVLDLNTYTAFEHHKQLQATMKGPGWRRIGLYPQTFDSFTDRNSRIEVWRQTGAARPAPSFIVEMKPAPRIAIAEAASH